MGQNIEYLLIAIKVGRLIIFKICLYMHCLFQQIKLPNIALSKSLKANRKRKNCDRNRNDIQNCEAKPVCTFSNYQTTPWPRSFQPHSHPKTTTKFRILIYPWVLKPKVIKFFFPFFFKKIQLKKSTIRISDLLSITVRCSM